MSVKGHNADLTAITAGIRSVWLGHAPNCSSSGSVVGLALVSTVAAAVVVNAWAGRLLRFVEREPQQPQDPSRSPRDVAVRIRAEEAGEALVAVDHGGERALLRVLPALADRVRQAGATEVGGARLRQPSPAPVGHLRAPTEVHIAVTNRCPVACKGCYLDAGPSRRVAEPATASLRTSLRALAELGVLEVAFGGGEGLLREDILDIAGYARDLGLVPNLTTSGFGLSPAVAAELASVMGQVNVSLDGLGKTYREVRGWSGAARGLTAVRTLVEAGARVGVNTVLTRPLFVRRGALTELAAAVAEAGATEWQWLRFKPAGRGIASYADLALSPAQAMALWPQALAIEADTGLVLRFDCALVPFLVAHQPPLALVERLGIRGCPAAHSLWTRSATGQWAPCSFVDGLAVQGVEPEGVSAAELADAWQSHALLARWRDRALAPPQPCANCAYSAVCRGGCRVVSQHLLGDALAPDPECPRVMAHGLSRTGSGQ